MARARQNNIKDKDREWELKAMNNKLENYAIALVAANMRVLKLCAQNYCHRVITTE